MPDAATKPPSMPTCHLEDLPSELLLMILGELPPASFWPLLSASPRCFHVFQARKASALESIVRRSIAPENWSLALAACGAPRIPSSAKPVPFPSAPSAPEEFFDVPEAVLDCPDDDDASDCSDETVTQLDFISAQSQPSAPSDISDASDVSELSELPPDRTEAGIGLTLMTYQEEWEAQRFEAGNVEHWSRLFKLSHVLDTFVTEYAQDALGKLSGILTPKAAQRSPQLSAMERSRLQRAFLRFEIYRKVCMTGLLIHDWSPLKMRPAFWRWFISPLAPWELEQMSAVHAYLWNRLEATAFDLEHDLAQHLNAQLARQAPTPTGNEPSTDAQPMKDYGLAMFQVNGDAGTRQEQLEFVLAMGLPLLRHLWRSEPAKQMSLLTSYMWRACDGLLNDVLRERWQLDRGINTTADSAFYVSPTSVPSPGWLWLRDSYIPWTFYRADALDRARVREVGNLGLVFWDAARLQRLGVYRTTLKRVFDSTEALAAQMVRRRSGKSVEERFGSTLSRAALEPLRPAAINTDAEEALLQRVEY